jgi:dienelactone hydrolase
MAVFKKLVSSNQLLVLITLICIQSCSLFKTDFNFFNPQFEVKTMDNLFLDFKKLNKQLPIRISYPATTGNLPVIVFSHGNGSKGDMYQGFTDYWASHGYVVIQPTHIDSTSLGFVTKRDNMREMYKQMLNVTDTRRQDMSFIIDSLDLIEEMIPDLKNRLDRSKLIAAGHSMGAATAMLVSGMKLVNPMDGTEESSEENRFKALLMISDPGTMTLMPKDPWKGVRIPTLISTGTEDFSDVGSTRMKSPFKYEVPLSLKRSFAPHHYLLIDKADHYLGGLICRIDVPGPPQYEALDIAAKSSVVFLNAYIKNDRNALISMRFGDMKKATNDKASLTLK